MIVEVVKEKVYVPEWNGNRDLPEADQIKVYHRFLSPSERGKFFYRKPLRIKVSGETESSLEYVSDEAGFVKSVVTKIENYAISEDGDIKEIKTADQLYSTGGVHQMLVSEIEQALLNDSPQVDTGPLA
jgi:hypothetical protein